MLVKQITLVKEKFYKSILIEKANFLLKIILVYLLLTNIVYADLKKNLINKLILTETLTFNFEQKIGEKEEKGKCFIKYPLLIKCNYQNIKQKTLISNGKTVAIIKKKYKKIYYYPLESTPLFIILDKVKVLNLIKKNEPSIVDLDILEFEFIDKKSNKIKIFFDKNTLELKGWKTKDVYSNNVSFIGTYELCTNNHGFKAKCNQIDNKNYKFAFIGDSFTEGTPIEYEDSFVGLFEGKTGYKTANLGIVSYSPKIYLSKINFLLKEGFKFDHVIVFIDISDFYDDTNFYSIDDNLVVTEKYSKKKNLKRRKFLRKNFPLTNFYMFIIKKYKFKKENNDKIKDSKLPVFTKKVNLKAKWTYSKTDELEGYDINVMKY